MQKGVLKDDFVKFLQDENSDDEKDSVVSWGTGHTTYTEIVTKPSQTVLTDSSTITPESATISNQEIEDRILLIS